MTEPHLQHWKWMCSAQWFSSSAFWYTNESEIIDLCLMSRPLSVIFSRFLYTVVLFTSTPFSFKNADSSPAVNPCSILDWMNWEIKSVVFVWYDFCNMVAIYRINGIYSRDAARTFLRQRRLIFAIFCRLKFLFLSIIQNKCPQYRINLH